MRDLWKFLTTPPVTEIRDYADLFGLIILPFWLGTWVAVIALTTLAGVTFYHDPTGSLKVIATIAFIAAALRWIVYPIATVVYERKETARWENERPAREAASARYEEGVKRRAWEAQRIAEIKQEMVDACSHPSTQRYGMGSSLGSHDGVQCAACGAFWRGQKMSPPHQSLDFFHHLPQDMADRFLNRVREGSNPEYSFVGPIIPRRQMNLLGKWLRNHSACHTNLPHYEMLLKEIKEGNYYFNLDDQSELEYLPNLTKHGRVRHSA